MTEQFDVESLAERMLCDYDARVPGTIFADGLRLSLDGARQLQNAVASLRELRGEQVVGYKIGCFCPENQKRFGLSHPVWGRLWSTEQYADGATLAKDNFANVAIEGEFAVTLNRNIGPDDVSSATVIESVEQIVPVIELHNLVLSGADPKGHELIANNAIHAGVVRGQGCMKPEADVETDLSVSFDGTTIDQWNRICWPDDIVESVVWLTKSLAENGLGIQQGQTILTGALGPPIPVAEISHVKVTSTHFGTVEALFS